MRRTSPGIRSLVAAAAVAAVVTAGPWIARAQPATPDEEQLEEDLEQQLDPETDAEPGDAEPPAEGETPGEGETEGEPPAEGEGETEGEPPAEGEGETEGEPPLGEEPTGEEAAEEPLEEAQGEPYEPATEPPEAARVPRTVCHGRQIREIRVEGARRVDPDDIRASIDLRRDIPCTDPEVSEAAQKLWNLGFFDDIVIEAEPTDRNGVILTIRVVERPAIGKIVYEGNDEVSDEDIDEKITLREGGILSLQDVREQVGKIRDLYAEEGYFLVEIEHELSKLPGDTNEVEVRFLIEEGEKVKVRRISFLGNENLPSGDLRKIMQTSQTGFFSFITSDDTFDRDAFDDDLTRLQAYYYDKGYLEMQIRSPRVELTADRRYIDVTIPVREGPRFRIGELSIKEVGEQGSEVEPLGGKKFLRSRIDAHKGEWFSRSTIAEGIQEITRFYRDHGYARVEIVPQTATNPDERIVDITVSIRRGPLVYIERININGNSKTADHVIRREVQIFEGELYNQTKIERSKERIQALGYFERVDVSEEDGSSRSRMVINFDIAERATGTFQVGAGFSSIESFIFTAQIQQNNLFGRGQSLTLQLQLSGIRQLIQARVREPYLFGTPWSLSLEGFKTIRQFQDFNRDSTGGGFTLGHPVFDDRLRFFTQYRLEAVDISARTGGLFGRGSGRGLGSLPRVTLKNLFRDGLTSSVRFGLTWDSRNNRLFPTEGVFASVSTEVADSYLGSDNVFTRYEGFFRYFRELWGPFVLKLNTEVGLITSRKNEGVPIFERYFLGGIFDVRGFPLNSLGPRAGLPSGADPNAPVREEGVALGGNLQAFYNLEVEFPIIEQVGIRGVVFTDGGNAWNLEDALCQAPEAEIRDEAADPCGLNNFRLRHSWGFGIRWFSPLGPLRFEWGLPFNPRDHEQKILFEFTIGNFF